MPPNPIGLWWQYLGEILMEKACLQLGDRYLAYTEHLHDDWTLIREYHLSPHLLAMSHVWHLPDGSNCIIAAKGAQISDR